MATHKVSGLVRLAAGHSEAPDFGGSGKTIIPRIGDTP